jgi:hypothetical protein
MPTILGGLGQEKGLTACRDSVGTISSITNNYDTKSDLAGIGLAGVGVRSMWIGLPGVRVGLPGIGVGSMWVGIGRLPRIGVGWLPGHLFPRDWCPPRSVSFFPDCAIQMILRPCHDESPALCCLPRRNHQLYLHATQQPSRILYSHPGTSTPYRNPRMDSQV